MTDVPKAEVPKITKIVFDGIQVTAFDKNSNVIAHVIGMSGRNGFNSQYLQDMRGFGPLVEGRYSFEQSSIQSRFSFSDSDNIVCSLGYLFSRVFLVPDDQTQSRIQSVGRDPFSFALHDSFNGLGSAGCIDLGSDNSNWTVLKTSPDGMNFDSLRPVIADWRARCGDRLDFSILMSG